MSPLKNMPRLRIALSLAVPLLALGLAACQSDPEELAPQCPLVSVIPYADQHVVYNGSGRDLTDLVFRVQIVDVQGKCKGTMGKRTLAAHAQLQMLVTRGPAASSREVDVLYGVGVVKDGMVLDRRDKTEHVVFPPNADTVRVNADPVDFVFPTPDGMSGPRYHLYYWLEISPEEKAANQAQH